ncbi:MAG: hypothetical protein ACJAYF_001167 [Arenicella sp.]|jgi:hypothetical protein
MTPSSTTSGFQIHRLTPAWHAVIAGLLSTSAYLYMANGSRHDGDFELVQLLSLSVFCAALSFWVWYVHVRQQQEINLLILLSFAILFRVIGGFTFPVLEDDFYRYLWDARMTVEFGSPYSMPPADFFDHETLSYRFERILDGINYPTVDTIYGPTCQWLFALAYVISPGEIWPLQALLGVADMLLILLLLKLAQPNSVLLYAWSPLIIKEFVITAHPDVLGALLVVSSLLVLHRRQWVSLGVFMALACGVKIFALILLPFLLRFEWKAWLAFLATAMLIAQPFGIKEAWFPGGLSAMGSSWLFNAPIYLLADLTIGKWVSVFAVKLALLGTFAFASAAYLIIYLKKGRDVIAHQEFRGDLLYLGLFLAAPVFNAWYLVWLLPFAVLRPSVWAWSLSTTILLSYATGINLSNSGLEPYQHWPSIIALEFLPIAIIATYSFLKNQQHQQPSNN